MTDSELKSTIGKRVRDFRLQNKYTQAQFAEIIDISINFLSEIENGKKGMSQDTICKLCQRFQISADYILFGITPDSDDSPETSETFLELANKLDEKDLDVVIQYLIALKKMKEKNL